MGAAQFFSSFPMREIGDDETSVRLQITGADGGTWSLGLKPDKPSCAPGARGRSNGKVEMSSEVFADLRQTPDISRVTGLWQAKRIAITGSLEATSAAFATLFRLFEGPEPESALLELFGMRPSDFHASFPTAAIVVHNRRAAARALFDTPALRDVDSLLAAWTGPVGVHGPGLSEDGRSINVPPGVAKSFVKLGCNLAFDRIERVVPQLRPWLTRILSELALPTGTESKCIGFFSSSGSGTVPHFDNNINITVQLQGRKTWKLAPNRHVQNPDFRYLIHDGRQELLGDRPALQLQQALPLTMPEEELDTITFEPGTIAYIPRGYWHATHASDDSLSFNFWFNTRDWRHLVLQAISDRLVRHATWRELARGAGHGGPFSPAARARLADLLQQLHREIGDMNVDEVLASARPHPGEPAPADEWYVQLFNQPWLRTSASEHSR
jgi:50S ribosomal protein L16 3-hydroxylase